MVSGTVRLGPSHSCAVMVSRKRSTKARKTGSMDEGRGWSSASADIVTSVNSDQTWLMRVVVRRTRGMRCI